jgi:hypothetical protein
MVQVRQIGLINNNILLLVAWLSLLMLSTSPVEGLLSSLSLQVPRSACASVSASANTSPPPPGITATSTAAAAAASTSATDWEPEWQQTSLYLAPSPGTGWGVYAGRSFSKGEIVEMAPMLLRFPVQSRLLKQTVLDNYHYEYWTWDGNSHVECTNLSFGFSLLYNHAPNHNIKYYKFGAEPDVQDPGRSVAMGYYAMRDIQKGEELVCSYGDETWFRQRGMEMIDLSDANNNEENQDKIAQRLQGGWLDAYECKLHSGYGLRRVRTICQHKNIFDDFEHAKAYDLESYLPQLPSFDAGYQRVTVKQRAVPGDIMQIAPVLVLSKYLVKDSLLEPLSLYWNELNMVPLGLTHLPVLDINELGYRIHKPTPVEDTVLGLLAGSVGLIARSTTDYNCRLEVDKDFYTSDSFIVRVVATQTIEVGEIVKVNLKETASQEIKNALIEELVLTGQPIPPSPNDESEDLSF